MNIFKKIPLHLPKRKSKAKKTAVGDIIYSPAQQSTRASHITGIILRALILFMGTFGLSAFVLDFCGLTVNELYWAGFYVPLSFVAFAAFAVTAVFGVAAYSRKAALIAYPAGIALYLIISAIANGDPFSFIVYSLIRVYNYTMYIMVSRGFMYFGDFMISEAYDYSTAAFVTSDPYRMGGAFLITAIIGIVLGIAVMKKIRLWLLAPFSALIIAPLLIFNMTNNSMGWAFTLAFLAATVTVYVYDYRFAGALEAKYERIRKKQEKKEEKKQKKLLAKTEKQRLREEADKMLMAALKADMGAKRSSLARKAVYKADKLAKKNAKNAAKLKSRAEKKQKKLDKRSEKLLIKSLKKEASGGSSDAKDALKEKSRLKAQLKSDRKQAKKEKRAIRAEARHHDALVSAAGGFAGLGAAAVALIAVGLPALIISKPFPVIEPVYNRLNIANTYVSAYLSGNDIDLNDLSAYGIEELMPRTLSFESLEFEDKPMFKVYTTGENNVYLKSWVGDSYDYYSDTWSGADYDKVLSFRQRFGSDFTPDSISTHFKNSVYPSTAEVTDAKVYKNFSKFGFNMQSVDVIRMDGYSRLLPIPASMDTGLGLLEMNTLNKSEKKYSIYYDGLYSSRFFEVGDPFRTVSYVSRMNREGVGLEMENAMKYYTESLRTIDDMKSVGPDSIDYNIRLYDEKLDRLGITYLGTSIVERYYKQMTAEEQEIFLANVVKERDYREYVNENYLTSFGSDKIEALAAELMAQAEAQGITTRHDLVVFVIDYLSDTCTYTITPNEELYPGAGSILDSFIFDVKEGYCTHFATAACAILRECGIPTRFAEGYIVTDYVQTRGMFDTTVLDNNAHAWVEVYYDGMGWVTYETTPEYADDMYSADSATFEPIDPEEDESDTPVTPPPVDSNEEDIEDDEQYSEEEEKMSELQLFVIVISCTAFGLLLIFILRLLIKRFIRRGSNMLDARYDLIKHARDEERFNDPKTDKHDIARRINDQILDIFATIGAAPEPGEVSSSYAERIAATYSNLSNIDPRTVFALIQKEEFGNGLTFEETALLADYLATITTSVYAGLSRFQKIKYRYILRKI